MDNLNRISERIGSLPKLANRDTPIFIDDVAVEFQQDLRNFIVGETLHMVAGRIVVGKNLYKEWLRKLVDKGFDYEISFR